MQLIANRPTEARMQSNEFLLQYLHFPHFWCAFYHSAYFGIFIYRCGNMRKDSGHVVCCLDQSASFRTFDSAFYFPHSAFRNSAFYPHPPHQYQDLADVPLFLRAVSRLSSVVLQVWYPLVTRIIEDFEVRKQIPGIL